MLELRLTLAEEEAALLVRLAREQGASPEALVHRAIALLAEEAAPIPIAEDAQQALRQRAIAVAGRFRSSEGGSVASHDDWLVEAYRQ